MRTNFNLLHTFANAERVEFIWLQLFEIRHQIYLNFIHYLWF